MPTNNNNKTDKKHRTEKKEQKRNSPTPPKAGKIYDKNAERLKQLRKSNSIVALTAGISDTVKAIKNRKKS